MQFSPRKTPGVYVPELSAFPNSVVPVATAVPVFIGYTATASYEGKSYTGTPVPINSWQDFETIFDADETAPAATRPRYQLIRATDPLTADLTIGGMAWNLVPDASTIYYLRSSVRLFYANGGGSCYILSIGAPGPARGNFDGTLRNLNVQLADFATAIPALEKRQEPTIVAIPDATLLSVADHATLNQQVLAHCGRMQSRVALLDVHGGQAPDPKRWTSDIAAFRTSVGTTSLGYGAAYYPFLRTTITADTELDYRNLGGAAALSGVLPNAGRDPLKSLLAQAEAPPAGMAPAQIENALRNASPDYANLQALLLDRVNILPTCGAMAGIYTFVDNDRGVWNAPANVSVAAATDTTLKITEAMQSGLNVDAATGKSINAIRLFTGQGVVVWGARTLDGNSQDWRYINVRRTMIMLEQSMKLALQAYVFQPNDANTWSLVQSALSNFLTQQWQAGALVGATPAAAFSVAVGLGVTMTADDILNGLMTVSVKVAISHPAEFIVVTLQQQMATAP